MIVDTVSFTATAPGAAGAAATVVAGDSAFVRSTGGDIVGALIAAWTNSQAVGFTQIVFPFGHDTSRNIRYRNVALAPSNQIPLSVSQPMRATDLISVTQAGSAVAGDVETVSMMIAYPDMKGPETQFIDEETLHSSIEDLMTVEDTVTATVASTYSGARALNAVTTSFKANRNYALIGAQIGGNGGALTIRGQDTGNLRVAIPCNQAQPVQTVNWFADLSSWNRMPLIPVINAANVTNTFIELMTNELLTAVPFSLTLALLKK